MNLEKLVNVIVAFTFKREGAESIKTRKTILPAKIKDYTLIADLQPKKNYPFKIGTYTDTSGQMVVIKVWKGDKNIHYYDLQHQIDVLRTMNAVSNRVNDLLPDDLRSIHWPKLIEVIRENDLTAIVTDFIRAKPVEKIDNLKTQWSYFLTVQKYLNTVAKYLTKNEVQEVKNKTLIKFLVYLPVITLLAIAENPTHKIRIIKAALKMVSAIPAFFNYQKFALVHGDLNYGNIMVNGRDIYLIDVEQTNVSYQEFELVTTLSTLGNTPVFKDKLTETIIKLAKKDKRASQRLGFLMLNCEIHNLTWNAPNENKVHYLELLDWGMKLIDQKI